MFSKWLIMTIYSDMYDIVITPALKLWITWMVTLKISVNIVANHWLMLLKCLKSHFFVKAKKTVGDFATSAPIWCYSIKMSSTITNTDVTVDSTSKSYIIFLRSLTVDLLFAQTTYYDVFSMQKTIYLSYIAYWVLTTNCLKVNTV